MLAALLRDPGRRDRRPRHRGARRGRPSPPCPGWSAACSPSTRTSCSSAGPAAGPAAAPTTPTTGRRACCSCRSTRCPTTPPAAPSATARCRTLAAWLRAGSHTLTSWHTDWSSQTGAAVSGILHGSNHDILGFRWYEKDRDHVIRVSAPGGRRRDRAPALRRPRACSPWTAPAAATCSPATPPHVSLTMSSLALRRAGRAAAASAAHPRPGRRRLLRLLRQPGERAAHDRRSRWSTSSGSWSAAARERRDDVRPRVHRGGIYPLARAGVTVISRDVVVFAMLEDMLAGRPVVYADFLGYDEAAHHAGLERADSLAVLRSDRPADRPAVPRRPAGAAPLPPRRALRPRADPGLGVRRPVRGVDRGAGRPALRRLRRAAGTDRVPRTAGRPVEGWQVTAALAASSGGPIARRLRARVERARTSARPRARARATPARCRGSRPAWSCVRLRPHRDGVVPRPAGPGLAGGDRAALARPAARRWSTTTASASCWCTPTSSARSCSAATGLHRLRTRRRHRHRPAAALRRARRRPWSRRVSTFPHCADVVINSRYDPDTDEASPFEPHVGSHGGLGGPQQHALPGPPARVRRRPARSSAPSALHRVLRGWLTDLGHPEPEASAAGDADRETAAVQA